MVASLTVLPVLGVPVESKALKGMDSLLSIVQMPGGVPVGEPGHRHGGSQECGIAGRADAGQRSSRVAGEATRFPQAASGASTAGRTQALIRHDGPIHRTLRSRTSFCPALRWAFLVVAN